MITTAQNPKPNYTYERYKSYSNRYPIPVSITFDTCDLTNNLSYYETAFPLLEQHGLKGTFFVLTDPIGDANRMTAAMIRAIGEAGHEIGSHTHTGTQAQTDTLSGWENELSQSKSLIETWIGKDCVSLAWHGSGSTWTQKHEQMVRKYYRHARGPAGTTDYVWNYNDSSLAFDLNPIQNPWNVHSGTINSVTYGTDPTGFIDTHIIPALERGACTCFKIHGIIPDGQTPMLNECQYSLIDNLFSWLASAQTAGLIECVTFDEYMNRLYWRTWSPAENLFPNEMFERDTDSDGLPDGVTTLNSGASWENDLGNGPLATDYYLQTTSGSIVFTLYFPYSDEGVPYRLSFFHKSSDGATKWRLIANIYSLTSGSMYTIDHTFDNAPTSWEEVSYIFPRLKNASYMSFNLLRYGSGTVQFGLPVLKRMLGEPHRYEDAVEINIPLSDLLVADAGTSKTFGVFTNAGKSGIELRHPVLRLAHASVFYHQVPGVSSGGNVTLDLQWHDQSAGTDASILGSTVDLKGLTQGTPYTMTPHSTNGQAIATYDYLWGSIAIPSDLNVDGLGGLLTLIIETY